MVSDTVIRTWMSFALSVGTLQETLTTATSAAPSAAVRLGKRMDARLPMGNGKLVYQHIDQRIGPPASVALQPAPALERQVLIHDRLRGTSGGDVEYQHAGASHVRQLLVAHVQQLLGRGLAVRVARQRGALRRDPVQLRVAQRDGQRQMSRPQ